MLLQPQLNHMAALAAREAGQCLLVGEGDGALYPIKSQEPGAPGWLSRSSGRLRFRS